MVMAAPAKCIKHNGSLPAAVRSHWRELKDSACLHPSHWLYWIMVSGQGALSNKSAHRERGALSWQLCISLETAKPADIRALVVYNVNLCHSLSLINTGYHRSENHSATLHSPTISSSHRTNTSSNMATPGNNFLMIEEINSDEGEPQALRNFALSKTVKDLKMEIAKMMGDPNEWRSVMVFFLGQEMENGMFTSVYIIHEELVS